MPYGFQIGVEGPGIELRRVELLCQFDLGIQGNETAVEVDGFRGLKRGVRPRLQSSVAREQRSQRRRCGLARHREGRAKGGEFGLAFSLADVEQSVFGARCDGESLTAFEQRDRLALRRLGQGADGERRSVPLPSVGFFVERGETQAGFIPLRLKCRQASLLDFSFVGGSSRALQQVFSLTQFLKREIGLPGIQGGGCGLECTVDHGRELREIFVRDGRVFQGLLKTDDLGADL